LKPDFENGKNSSKKTMISTYIKSLPS